MGPALAFVWWGMEYHDRHRALGPVGGFAFDFSASDRRRVRVAERFFALFPSSVPGYSRASLGSGRQGGFPRSDFGQGGRFHRDAPVTRLGGLVGLCGGWPFPPLRVGEARVPSHCGEGPHLPGLKRVGGRSGIWVGEVRVQKASRGRAFRSPPTPRTAQGWGGRVVGRPTDKGQQPDRHPNRPQPPPAYPRPGSPPNPTQPIQPS